MNKLHTYLLPVAAGSVGLLWTPLSNNAAITYGILAFAVIVGIVGLHSLTKQREMTNASLQQGLKVMEDAVKVSNNEITNKLQQQLETYKEGNIALNQQLKQEFAQLQITIVGQMEKTEQTVSKQQSDMKQAFSQLEEKIEEGNKVLENVSILMIQELKNIVQITDELVSIQNTMPNELSMLQDAITTNQQDALDTARNLEMHLEKLADLQDIIQSHFETSTLTHEHVVAKIADEFGVVSTNLDVSIANMLAQVEKYNEKVYAQMNNASTMVEKVEQLQTELGKLSEQSTISLSKQLTELKNMNKALLEGISQIADSKSVERQQLLKIQKKLVESFSS
ncbi:hypothetical protein C3943_21580 [Lysinibacillus sp. B2A1]|nr:hypothetical protein C3943_21580 [Lysinibacillus sp. B2A1]